MGAKLNRGASRQDYQTPVEFLDAVRRRLGVSQFTLDLAASEANKVADQYYSLENSAFQTSNRWTTGSGWAWCNPPYSDIEPWVERASFESTDGNAQIAMLVPASVGANWWKNYVHDKAHVLLLNGRITFVGQKDPYPKDCALLLYTPFSRGGYEIWSWNA